jgi:hypothetical protein
MFVFVNMVIIVIIVTIVIIQSGSDIRTSWVIEHSILPFPD